MKELPTCKYALGDRVRVSLPGNETIEGRIMGFEDGRNLGRSGTSTKKTDGWVYHVITNREVTEQCLPERIIIPEDSLQLHIVT